MLVLAAVSLVLIFCDLLTTGKIGLSWFASVGFLFAAGFVSIHWRRRRSILDRVVDERSAMVFMFCTSVCSCHYSL